jgi:hypothetical protein
VHDHGNVRHAAPFSARAIAYGNWTLDFVNLRSSPVSRSMRPGFGGAISPRRQIGGVMIRVCALQARAAAHGCPAPLGLAAGDDAGGLVEHRLSDPSKMHQNQCGEKAKRQMTLRDQPQGTNMTELPVNRPLLLKATWVFLLLISAFNLGRYSIEFSGRLSAWLTVIGGIAVLIGTAWLLISVTVTRRAGAENQTR